MTIAEKHHVELVAKLIEMDNRIAYWSGIEGHQLEQKSWYHDTKNISDYTPKQQRIFQHYQNVVVMRYLSMKIIDLIAIEDKTQYYQMVDLKSKK